MDFDRKQETGQTKSKRRNLQRNRTGKAKATEFATNLQRKSGGAFTNRNGNGKKQRITLIQKPDQEDYKVERNFLKPFFSFY